MNLFSEIYSESIGLHHLAKVVITTTEDSLVCSCKCNYVRLQVHQLLRELSYGIYAFNQLPGISLEPNDDKMSSCQLPPVYHDTRVGRLLTEVDATLKCLWHGVCFPREKRLKFAARWRGVVGASGGNIDLLAADKESRNQLLAEFISAGSTTRFESLAVESY